MSNFDRYQFYPKNKILYVNHLDKILSDLVINKLLHDNYEINEISSLENIIDQSILFLNKGISNIQLLKKNLVVITDDLEIFNHLSNKNIFLVNNINNAFNIVINHMYYHEDNLQFHDEFIHHNNSFISKFSKIDNSVKIGNNCVIGRGVKIGSNTIIKNNVVIKNSILSKNIIISDNTTIGCTGFGFDLRNMGSINLNPHVGIVYIDDYVNIGSNCTIDRAKIDITSIGKNSMIDNLVHIAHNVKLGENGCIAAQTGISGSTVIGNNLIVGGQSGIAGHLSIGDNVVVAAKSGVTKNIKSNSVVAGFPAIDIKEWKKNIIKSRKNI